MEKMEKTKRQLTAVYQRSAHGYIGWIEEMPGANTQGVTFSEVKENLKEAAALIIEANRVLTKTIRGTVIREPLRVSV